PDLWPSVAHQQSQVESWRSPPGNIEKSKRTGGHSCRCKAAKATAIESWCVGHARGALTYQTRPPAWDLSDEGIGDTFISVGTAVRARCASPRALLRDCTFTVET